MKPKVYYAHSMALYGSAQEKRDVELLEHMGFEVVNPSAEPHKTAIIKIRAQSTNAKRQSSAAMRYFEKVVKGCNVLAFRAHPDGKIGAGVGQEIDWAYEDHLPVFELPVAISQRKLSVEQTREFLRECGSR